MVWTNLVVRETKMGKHEIEYRMSNPKASNRGNN